MFHCDNLAHVMHTQITKEYFKMENTRMCLYEYDSHKFRNQKQQLIYY